MYFSFNFLCLDKTRINETKLGLFEPFFSLATLSLSVNVTVTSDVSKILDSVRFWTIY